MIKDRFAAAASRRTIWLSACLKSSSLQENRMRASTRAETYRLSEGFRRPFLIAKRAFTGWALRAGKAR